MTHDVHFQTNIYLEWIDVSLYKRLNNNNFGIDKSSNQSKWIYYIHRHKIVFSFGAFYSFVTSCAAHLPIVIYWIRLIFTWSYVAFLQMLYQFTGYKFYAANDRIFKHSVFKGFTSTFLSNSVIHTILYYNTYSKKTFFLKSSLKVKFEASRKHSSRADNILYNFFTKLLLFIIIV